jgi:hypothetical protein
MNNTFTFNIYKEGTLLKTLTNQSNDACVYKEMHRLQSNSISWALFYEGYKIECINEQTNKKEISNAKNNMYWNWLEISCTDED